MKRLLIYLGLLATLLAMPYHAKADTMWLHFWGGYGGSGTSYEMGGTGDNTWAYSFYTKDCTNQTVYLLPVANNSVYMKAYSGETYSDLGNNSSVLCWKEGANNKYDVSIKLPDDYNTTNYKVTISATEYNNSYFGIKLTVTWEVTTNEEDHDYYWVSPQITNGEMWPSFKMVASRNRYWDGNQVIGDGKISTKYYTFTIKDDDLVWWKTKDAIDNGTKIQWYILRDDGKVVYRPSTNYDAGFKPHDNNPYDANHPISGNTDNDGYVSYINFWNGSSYDGLDAYMTTDANRSGSWAFKKGSALAHTFNLNAEKGHVLYNYTNKGADTSRGYNLVGNWTAGTKVSIHLSDGKPMTKYWFKNGVESETEVANADSIVYKINVKRPAGGWGGLYLDISPSDNGTEDNDANWGRVFRPLITTGNNLDGRALHGALTTRKDEQSLNPETSDDYTSYTFSFNATTMTYRLEFHTSLYLVGPGVSATKEKSGSWDLSDVESSDPRIRLTATQEKDHYRNLVYFTNGKQFRFIKNTDESATPNYKYTWYENDNKPKWKSAASDGEYYPDNETQFRNYMVYENGTGSTGSTSPTEATANSMSFDLPTGWYYVNFYPNAGKPYYTIEHSMELRDFNDVYYRAAGTAEQRNVKGRNNYNFLRVWSDHIAWNKPDNIDVFVVSEFNHDAENHTTTATLKKLDIDYIPANKGVILGCKLSKDNLTSGLVYDNAATLAYKNGQDVNYYNTLTAELTPYSTPSTSYNETSQLIPLYSETSLKRFSDDTGIGTGEGYANYLFGFYRCKKYQQNYSGNDNDFQMGFWLTTGNGKTYANSAFLHLTKAQAEDLGVGTTYETSASAASAPAFMLLFDESDDNVITGISDITTAKGNSVASQGWYTLQGVRTAKPTQRGIYIYNGKKVIVND